MEKKSFNYYMRLLHRDIGYLVIGFVIIYALSGIILTYRDTGFLKHEVNVHKILSPNLDPSQLGRELRLHDFKIMKQEGNIVFFKGGNYDSSTGHMDYTIQETPKFLERFLSIHKAPSSKPIHWINVIFGIALIFLAISSFWMYKKGTRVFKRSLVFTAIGLIITVILVYL